MSAPFHIRRLHTHEWELYRRTRLRSLADSPHAFGSTYAAEQQRPGALWQARLLAVTPAIDCPLIAENAEGVVGLVWGKTDAGDPALAHVYQMWVAPEARGQGVGKALIDGVVDWARSNGARVLRLAVTSGNASAAALYLRAGFQDVGGPMELHEGSPVVSQVMELALVD